MVPVLSVSSVTGEGLDLLRSFCRNLPTPRHWQQRRQNQNQNPGSQSHGVTHTQACLQVVRGGKGTHASSMLMHVGEAFFVAGVGTVVAGTVVSGTVWIGETLLLGPGKTK